MEKHLSGDDVNSASNQVQRGAPARANQVSKDQRNLIRVLSADHDLKTISQLTNVPYANVRQIISRSQRKAQNQTSSQIVTNPVQQVAERISDELAENERETRLSLSRYARRAAKDSESASLKDSPYVKQAAQVAGLAFRWDAEKPGQQFTLNVLNINSITDNMGDNTHD